MLRYRGWTSPACALVVTLMGSATRQGPPARPPASRVLSVTARDETGAEPGVALAVRLRDVSGRVIAEARTGANGHARLSLEREDVPAGARLEVLMDLGAGRTVGTIESLSGNCDSYEVFLPRIRLMQCHGTIEREQ